MGKTVSTPTLTGAQALITRPGHLVEFGFATPVRYSTRATLSWNSLTWTSGPVVVSGKQENPNGGVSISIVVQNTDLAFGALCLAEDAQEKSVKIYSFYEGATAAGDPILEFEGVIDSVNIDTRTVQVNAIAGNQWSAFVPRRRITRQAGFNRLSPAGRIIQFNGDRFKLTSTP